MSTFGRKQLDYRDADCFRRRATLDLSGRIGTGRQQWQPSESENDLRYPRLPLRGCDFIQRCSSIRADSHVTDEITNLHVRSLVEL